MRILWFSWKDHLHPLAGGAEVMKAELCKRLVSDGHEIVVFSARYKGSAAESMHAGYKIIRQGGRFGVYWFAWRYYRKNLKGWPNLVIDEVNTVPFFAKLYVKERNLILIYQLARQVWFYQMAFPLSLVGYLMEPIYLRLLTGSLILTESNSTKEDLVRHGFNTENIRIFPIGLSIKPIIDLKSVKKYTTATLLSHSTVRPMKCTLDQIKAFELAKESIPNLHLIISGDANDKYGLKVLSYINRSLYKNDIEYCGRTTHAKKIQLMQRSHYILSTAVKEGWGLTITEAASQGTPAIVYDADGLRDSVRNANTGYITDRSIRGLADKIESAFADSASYQTIRKNAWQWSRTMTFEKSYEIFKKAANL